MIIDPGTLQIKHTPVADLEKTWNGYALVLSPKRGIPLFRVRMSGRKSADLAPKERFDEVYNFGLVDSGSLLEHSFTIRNETNGLITLRIVGKSCSCISAELEHNKLVPGHESSLKIHLNVDKLGWSTAVVAVEMRPVSIVKRYAVQAYGKDSFRTTPAIGYIGAPNSGVVEYPVRITYYTDSNDIVTFERMESIMDGLVVSRIVTEKIPKGEFTVVNFDLTLRLDCGKPTNAVRRIQEDIRFCLASCKGKRSIPFKLSATIGQK